MKLFGSLTAITFSPIVTIEPRRRKFHCPIKLKIPLPPGHRPDTSINLRLLCSITGGQSKAAWQDVTGSTPLSIHDKCLLFTTTVSARFWLVHCQRSQRCQDAARFAQELWRYLVQVPFMAKFVVFAKRRDISEAQVRVFCMTDDREEKTLEVQEHYTLVARSRDVEVLHGQVLYLEFGGNLIPAHLGVGVGGAAGQRGLPPPPRGGRPNSGLLVASSSALLNEQLAFAFRAFHENRLAFACRLREVAHEPSGRIAFMEDSLKYLASLNAPQRAYLNERRRRAVCTLGVQLPAMCVHYDNILGTPKRNSYYATARIGDLTLADIASELSLRAVPAAGRQHSPTDQPSPDLEVDSLNGHASPVDYPTTGRPQVVVSGSGSSSSSQRPDWVELAPKLGIPRDEVEFIAEHCTGSSGVTPALLLLMHWYRLSSPDDRDQDLARGLVAIGRDDIASKLNFPIEPKRISRSTMELLREIEMIPVRSTENLYGTSSELSGYAGLRNQRATSSTGRGASSLRRLDSREPTNEQEPAGAFEQQRRRAASTSSAQQPQQQRSQPTQGGNYFSSGLRSAGQSAADTKVMEAPTIEVSQVNGLEQAHHDDSIEMEDVTREGGDMTTFRTTPTAPTTTATTTTTTTMPATAPATTTSADADSRSQQQQQQQQQQHWRQQGDCNSPTREQQSEHIEQMAQSLVDDLLGDALEAYLRRELQQTAEETVREALAAAGGGKAAAAAAAADDNDDDDDDDDDNQSGVESQIEPVSWGSLGLQAVHGGGGLADDEMSQGEDEDDDDENTFTQHHSRWQHYLNSHQEPLDRLRAYSTSPSRVGGGDIFEDLSEMSNYADRIDSILDQTASEHSTRSGGGAFGLGGGRLRSASPMPPPSVNFDYPQHQQPQGEGELEELNDEVD